MVDRIDKAIGILDRKKIVRSKLPISTKSKAKSIGFGTSAKNEKAESIGKNLSGIHRLNDITMPAKKNVQTDEVIILTLLFVLSSKFNRVKWPGYLFQHTQKRHA
jgi:hypothetical protein